MDGALTDAACTGDTSSVPAFVFAGTAGWSLPRAEQARFPGDGTHLERYARDAVEVWCIFDNTANGAAVPNALELLERLPSPSPERRDT